MDLVIQAKLLEMKIVAISAQMYLIVLPLCFVAALVDAIGGGGGLISLPAYTLAGLDYGMASGCNKLSACSGTLMATFRFFKGGKILWKPAVAAVLGTLPGAWLGTRLSMLLSDRFMHIFMICAIPVVGVLVVLEKDAPHAQRPMNRGALLMCFGAGLLMGAYDGFFGPGMGTFLILLLTSLTGMDMVQASATAKPINLASNLSSLITRLAAGQVIFALAVPAMAFSMAGGWVGSKLAMKRGAKFIRFVMLGVLGLLVITLIADLV